MADEKPMQILFAMADVLGLFIIALFTLLVAGFGLKLYDGTGIVTAVALPVGLVTLIVTYVAYHNNNLLGTAIFGPLAAFFLTFFFLTSGVLPGLAAAGAFPTAGGMGNAIAVLLAFIGIVIFIDAIISIWQPVRLLPVLLFVAAIAFWVTALFYSPGTTSDSVRLGFGALWMLYTLISLYMAPAIMTLVMKGKAIFPLFIKSAAKA